MSYAYSRGSCRGQGVVGVSKQGLERVGREVEVGRGWSGFEGVGAGRKGLEQVGSGWSG